MFDIDVACGAQDVEFCLCGFAQLLQCRFGCGVSGCEGAGDVAFSALDLCSEGVAACA